MTGRIAPALLCAVLLALSIVFSGFDASAQSRKRVPRFEDFPVKEVYTGKTPKLALKEEDQESHIYYQAIADGGANFAGYYAIVPVTCGDRCGMIELIDMRTGKLIEPELSFSGWKQTHDAFRQAEFRRTSRLIVFAGQIDEKGPIGWHFYRYDGGKLKRLHTVVTRGDFRKPLAEWMK